MAKKAQKKIELNLSILMDDDSMLFSPTELKELATEVAHGR